MSEAEAYPPAWYAEYDKYDPDRDGKYDGEGRLRYNVMIGFLDTRLRDSSGKRVLQVGAGTGTFSVYFAKKYPSHHFVMTDINPHALALMENKIAKYGLRNAVARQLDIRQMDDYFSRDAGRVDIIFAQAVLFVLSPNELLEWLRTIKHHTPEIIVGIAENCVVEGPWLVKALNRILPAAFQLRRFRVAHQGNLPRNRGKRLNPAWSQDWFVIPEQAGYTCLLHEIEYYSAPWRVVSHPQDDRFVNTLTHSLVLGCGAGSQPPPARGEQCSGSLRQPQGRLADRK